MKCLKIFKTYYTTETHSVTLFATIKSKRTILGPVTFAICANYLDLSCYKCNCDVEN